MNAQTLRSIRSAAVFALAGGSARVSLPVLKPYVPSGRSVCLGDNCGPIGTIESIQRRDRFRTVLASFQSASVIFWCDRQLKPEREPA